jgi:hypothetical protein
MSLYCKVGSADTDLSGQQLNDLLVESLDKLGPRKRVLVIPPDITRLHSGAGELTRIAWKYYGARLAAILPALGTHAAMSPEQMTRMFGDVPQSLFHIHNWRTDIETIGEVPATFIEEQSEGKLHYPWLAQINRLLLEGNFDLILSIGQVVPHEVIGMANYNKNVLIGTGGREGINRSHYLGAVYGMERIMGRADNPVRRVLNYASDRFLKNLPHCLCADGGGSRGRWRSGDAWTVHRRRRGVFSPCVRTEPAGELSRCWTSPCARRSCISIRMSFTAHGSATRRCTARAWPWRTDAELIILAPAVKEFGEDRTIDALIRKYGYRGTPATLDAVAKNADLAADLSAAAHLIHGSSEGRFTITWCPGHLTSEEVEGVGFNYGDLNQVTRRYDPAKLQHGFNSVDGEEIFFVANPGLGLWAHRDRFRN